MEVSGQLHAPAALSPGNNRWYPLDRRLCGPLNQSGRGGKEKNPQGGRRLLQNEHHNLCSTPDVIKVIK